MIRKTLLLACDPDRAFELLTRQAGAWWPPDRRHTQDPRSQIFIEPGGRFFERATDGREVELGVVRVFSPPERLVLDWYPGSGAEQPTHVEIALRAEGDGTRWSCCTKRGRSAPRPTDATKGATSRVGGWCSKLGLRPRWTPLETW